MKSIFVLLSIMSVVAPQTAFASPCTADDISTGNVKNCVCDTNFGVGPTKCGPEKYGLYTCGDCGAADNYKSDACNLYFGSRGVCGCLKEFVSGQTGECIAGKSWTGSGRPPIWTLHNGPKP